MYTGAREMSREIAVNSDMYAKLKTRQALIY